MKYNELIYDVRENLKQYMDDTELDDRYIIYHYNIKRAKYLRQELNNFQRTVDISNQQTLCLELEEVPSTQCGTAYNCATILRTKKPIPKPLELHTKSAITSIKSVERLDIPFNFVSKDKAVYQQYAPFNKAVYVFLDDDMRLYFVSKLETLKFIECITVTGVFEDPLDLANYNNCCGCPESKPCFSEDSEYPIQAHMVDLIRNEIVNMLTNREQIIEDRDNDANDETNRR